MPPGESMEPTLATARPDHGGRAAAAAPMLVEAVRQLEGLTEQVGPFRLRAEDCDRAPEAVAAVCRALGVPLSFDAPDDGDHAVLALGARIRGAQADPRLSGLSGPELDLLQAGARRLKSTEDRAFRVHSVRRPDATLVKVVETGPAGAPCVVVSPACAMSYRLALPWLRALGGTYRCLVLQTRGTSWRIEDPEVFDRRGHDVHLQAEDLMAVIETLTSGPVHVMGMCGGAVTALYVAAQQPDYVHSLSLWHADLDLGPDAAKTDHQANLRALLDAAAGSRAAAAAMRDLLVGSPLTGFPEHIGPIVVRPYASGELLYRYAHLVRATMHWDSRPAAEHVPHPALVVTSRDDHTAHPAGSRRVAEILPGGRLEVTDHGTHLDAFAASPHQVALLTSFLATSGLR